MQLLMHLGQIGRLRFASERGWHRLACSAAMAMTLVTAGADGALAGQGSHLRYNAVGAVMASAAGGNPAAQARLGSMYSNGRGVPQNYFEAAKWYFRAAEQGEGEAQRALGMLYNKGEGVPKDLMLAYMWLNLSAAQGVDSDFRTRLRDAIASKMTAQQVQVAQRMSLDWYRAR
jgi:TPR repeat protein